LKNEDVRAGAEPVIQVAVRVVEQERGLELQINFPESTFATMLPIVMVIAAANVLNMEFLSAKLEAAVRELLSNLNIEVFSTRIEA